MDQAWADMSDGERADIEEIMKHTGLSRREVMRRAFERGLASLLGQGVNVFDQVGKS
jgi:2-iminoacetate synthase ThiH